MFAFGEHIYPRGLTEAHELIIVHFPETGAKLLQIGRPFFGEVVHGSFSGVFLYHGQAFHRCNKLGTPLCKALKSTHKEPCAAAQLPFREVSG